MAKLRFKLGSLKPEYLSFLKHQTRLTIHYQLVHNNDAVRTRILKGSYNRHESVGVLIAELFGL